MSLNKDKIHVLQIVGDPVGGIRRHIHDIVKHYNTDKYVLSYAHSKDSWGESYPDEDYEIENRLSRRLILDIKKNPHITDLLNIIQLIRFVNKNKVLVIHGHGAKGGLYARLISCLTNAKSVYTPHGGSMHAMFGRVKGIMYIWIEKVLSLCTDYYIFESNYSFRRFSQVIKKDIKEFIVNPNSIEQNYGDNFIKKKDYNSSLNDRSINVGVFGVLRKEKGQLNAILMMPSLLKHLEHKSVLHLVGTGPDEKILKQLVVENNLSSNVQFYGEVDDVRELMSNVDAVLIPSLYESFGYVAIESMAMKKPVIAANVGGLKDIITNHKTGVLLDINSPEDIVKALLEWNSKSKDEKERIVDCAYQMVREKYNLNTMVEGVENIYSKLSVF